jgi:hypothetical protein
VLGALLSGGTDERAGEPTAAPSATPTPVPSPAGGADALALGITEPNPAFLVAGGPPAFAAWRDDLAAIRPSLYRLVVDWPAIAAPDGTGIDLARPHHGCMRDRRPCAPFAGVRAQLEALAAVQRAQPGRWIGMAVFTGTPDGLARPARGCERDDVQARSRPPREDALGAYRQAVRAVAGEAARAGASVPYWSAWNEPNHPYFLSPQRARCSPRAPSLAAAPYVGLARALLAELDAAPGEQRLVLGETAGLFARRATTTPVPAFVRALPRDLVCRAAVYGQHGYVDGEDPVPRLSRALAAFRCPEAPRIWITETGIKAASRAGCRAVHARLVRWWRDPRVDAAFQYTLREDDRFPTGLVSTDLRRAHPVLGAWRAWGARPDDRAAPPPVSCSARPAATAPGT